MSILTEPLKNTVTVSGISYPVNTDFRVWLKIHRLVTENNINKITEAIILCYKGGVLPPSFFEAVSAMWDFMLADDKKGKGQGGKRGVKIFDFTQDAELIYASFLQDYGIDLLREDMHWHRFLALFKNLSPKSPFMRVAQIRATNLADIKDSALKAEIRKKQRFFALEGQLTDREFEDNLALLM